jgi:hypothetical protein
MAKKSSCKEIVVPVERIERRIYLIRKEKVMIDGDLAELYHVPTKRLNEAVKRNPGRFPQDFMFQLTREEAEALRLQIATSRSRSQIATLKRGQNIKYLPYVFTEHGVAMLSAVLNSDRAVQMSVLIVRAFVRMRELIASHKDLAARIEKLESNQDRHASVINLLAEEIDNLKLPPPEPPKGRIGFVADTHEK